MSSGVSSIVPRRLIRKGVALLGAAVIAGCKSIGEPVPSGVSLTMLTNVSVVQGQSQPVTATFNRLGGYSGPVNVTCTGLPAGVTATVSKLVTSGTVTTATITVVVDTGVPAAVYQIVVHGTGDGVSEVTRALALVVMTPPPPPGYIISMTPSFTIMQGADWSYPTINLQRTSFTLPVKLTVENVPAGVDAFIEPSGASSGTVFQLWLNASADAPTGTFTNVVVRGVSAGFPDQTARLALTVAVPPFALRLGSPTLSIVKGGPAQTLIVNVIRNDFIGPVTLHIDDSLEDGYPPGLVVGIVPNATNGNRFDVSIAAGSGAVSGVFYIWFYGEATSGRFWTTALTLTIVQP
jgi:hypothetical protein